MLKILCAGHFGLSLANLVQFTVKMYVVDQNREKFTKTLLFGVQDHSRSSLLTNLKSPSPVLVMMCSMSVFTLDEPIAAK